MFMILSDFVVFGWFCLHRFFLEEGVTFSISSVFSGVGRLFALGRHAYQLSSTELIKFILLWILIYIFPGFLRFLQLLVWNGLSLDSFLLHV